VLEELSSVLRKMSDDMDGISKGFQELMSDKNQKAIRESLKNLNLTLQSSHGTLGNFTQQVIPGFMSTMDRFDSVLNRMEPFVSTLQDNPSALLRGKPPSVRGPGE
jgi:phage-related protein